VAAVPDGVEVVVDFPGVGIVEGVGEDEGGGKVVVLGVFFFDLVVEDDGNVGDDVEFFVRLTSSTASRRFILT